MASLTQWTWIWVSSGSWWWTGGLACCSPWGHEESNMTERLYWTDWIVLLEVRLYTGFYKVPITTEIGGLNFCAVGRPPFIEPIGWLGLKNIIITPGALAGTENKDNQTRKAEDLSGLKGDFLAASLTSASDGEERTGNIKWPVYVIDCVLSTLLLLWYFSNLIIGAIMRWWESICIWTVSCSSSVSQGVPEETKATIVHMVWKRTPCLGSNMCGSANCCSPPPLGFWKVA